MTLRPLAGYARNDFSQNGEDGVLSALLERLNVPADRAWCVEFGAWDGIHLSNTYNLIRNASWPWGESISTYRLGTPSDRRISSI